MSPLRPARTALRMPALTRLPRSPRVVDANENIALGKPKVPTVTTPAP